MASKAVELKGDASVQAQTLLDLFQSGEIYSASVIFESEDPQEVQRRIREQKLLAKDFDQLMDASTTQSSKDKAWHNRPLGLLSVKWSKADQGKYPNSLPVIAIISAVTYDGEPVVITTGSEGLVFDLALATARGWITRDDADRPVHWVRIVAKDTPNGEALNLESAPAPF